jgi:hypothetical protein
MSVERVAARQWGVVSRAQALDAGLTRHQIARRISSGRWIVLRRGVFAIAGTPPSWEQAVVGAVLRAGEGAVASHFTAGAIWGLPNFGREYLEISTDRPERRRIPGVVTHRTVAFLAAEHTVLRGIPVSSVARTLVDCSSRLSVPQLGTATDHGLRTGQLRLEDLRRCVAGLPPAPGRHPRKIQAILSKRLVGYDPGESGLQMHFARGLVEHGCPEPVLEHQVRLGRKKYRVDLSYPEVKVGIEIDSWEWHHTRTAFDGDRSRANDLVTAGWTLLRFTSNMTTADAARLTATTLGRFGRVEQHNRPNVVGGGKVG